MTKSIEDLQEELITKHNFIVKVTTDSTDSLCVMVNFAGRKQAYYRIVADEEGEVYGLAYWSSYMAKEIEEYIPLNKYIIRIYIVCDIFRQCRSLDLSYEIIRYFSPTGEKIEFTELLDIPMDDQDREVEKVLENCMAATLNGAANADELYEALEKDGLRQNFNILISTLI